MYLKKSLLIFVFTIVYLGAVCQPSLEPKPDLSNPQSAIFTHLYFLQDDSYQPEKSALTIYGEGLSLEKRKEFAIKIKQILDGKGIYVDINLLPDKADYIDSITGKNHYFISAFDKRIYLEKRAGKWYYSNSTVSQVDKIFKEVYPWGTEMLSTLLPEKISDKRVFLLKNWQWLGIGIVLLACFIGFYILKILNTFLVNLFFKIDFVAKSIQKDLVAKISRSFGLLITFFFLMKFIPSLMLPPRFSHYLVISANILTIIFLSVYLTRVVKFAMFYAAKFAEKTETKLDDQLVPIIEKILKFVIVLATISFCLRALNVDIVAILAGLSVGALALALAAQDTVKNFIGSITILIDHPFEIGDFINVNGVSGVVEEVGFRATRIRTLDQSLAYIPNGNIANANIDNLGLRIYRRWQFDVGVTYNTPSDKIEVFTKEIRNIVDSYPHTFADRNEVWLNSLANSSINIYVNVFLAVPTWTKELECKNDLLLQIIRKADELGVSFAFPSQSVYIESMPKQEK